MTDDLDVTQPLRDGLLASSIVSELPNYHDGKPIFTRRPVPSDAPYPMIVISSDVLVTDQDGIDHERSVVVRDIAVYGRNDSPAAYRQVTDMAYAVRHLFHSRRDTLVTLLMDDSAYQLIDIRASGPRPAPTDDEQTVGRLVELTIRLAKR